jgi:hypothetical protein
MGNPTDVSKASEKVRETSESVLNNSRKIQIEID